MPTVTTPFLDRPTFEAMFRPLSAGEATLADKLLLAASQWITDRKPDIAPDDPMAVLVTFEVVRDAFAAVPELAGRTQYTITTDDRTESGTLAAASGMLDFNERHRMLLGLSATAGPAYGGMDGDFGGYGDVVAFPGLAAVVVGEFPD